MNGPARVLFDDRLDNAAIASTLAAEQRIDPQRANGDDSRSLGAGDPFIDNLAHALRSSLNGIRTWASLLGDRQGSVDSPMVERAIAGIHAGVDQQVRLIDALCDASDVLAGRVRLRRRPMPVLPAIGAAVQRVRSAIDAKAIGLDCQTGLVDETIDGDDGRVVQVFEELLCNAVRYTPPGGCIRVTSQAVTGRVVVAIADTGRGLVPGFATWLFDPARAVGTDGVDGRLGLGLAVSKALVLLHDGTIDARSAGPGHGTTMTITLPLARSPLAVV